MRRARAVCFVFAALAIASVTGCSVVTSFDGFAPACGDVVSSSANCGACGHDCLGGACVAGACQPVALADQVQSPGWIGVDSTDVYWLRATETEAEILHVAKTGGAVGSLGTVASLVTAFAMDETDVYVAALGDTTSILEVSKATGAAMTIATSDGYAVGMTLDAGNVYWSEDSLSDSTGDIMRAAKNGSGSALIATVTGDVPAFGALVDASFVYWANFGSIAKAPIAGGEVTPLVGIGGQVYGLTLAGGLIVYTDPIDGLVNAEPAGGGDLMTLATSPGPTSITTDGTSIYWCDQGSGTIYAAPIGGPAKKLATGQADPVAIAVDDAAVYWTNFGASATASGSVMRLAK